MSVSIISLTPAFFISDKQFNFGREQRGGRVMVAPRPFLFDFGTRKMLFMWQKAGKIKLYDTVSVRVAIIC